MALNGGATNERKPRINITESFMVAMTGASLGGGGEGGLGIAVVGNRRSRWSRPDQIEHGCPVDVGDPDLGSRAIVSDVPGGLSGRSPIVGVHL
jgi:hypothetical protein